MTVLSKKDTLESLYEQISEQQASSELAHTATQLVPGCGSVDAHIMFIGEAPGRKEDESGVPFQGSAGSVLDDLLDSVDIERRSVYITNIIKYRPPNNRDPSKKEKQLFLPYLLQEISIIRPKVVVPLGRHAMEYFIPNQTISEAHGNYFSYNLDNVTYRIFPLYHPAATIYNRSLRNVLFEDMKKLVID